MNTQVNVRMPDQLLKSARSYAKKHGFGTVQELMKESLREKVFEEELLSKEEVLLVKKLAQATQEKKLWKSEKQLFAALKR